MKPSVCSQSALVEALYDRRLGSPERASMERHLAGCAECAAHLAELERLRDGLRAPLPSASPLEHQRARAALLRSAAAPSVAPKRMPWTLAAAAAFAVVFAAAAGFGAARLGGGTTAVLHPAPLWGAVGEALVALDTAPAERPTSLRPSADARFERTLEGKTEIVSLSTGAVDVTVRHLGDGERFLVRTDDAEVEVRGTIFRVEAENRRIRRVSVSEGKVSVRQGGMTAMITAGGSWEAASEAVSSEPVAVSRANAKGAPPKVAWRPPPRPEEPRPKEVEAPAPTPEAPPQAALRPASQDFAAAVGTLGAGDYGAAEARLSAFAATYPGDARAEEAAYLRAIALERSGRLDEAREAARAYVARWPAGVHGPKLARLLSPR